MSSPAKALGLAAGSERPAGLAILGVAYLLVTGRKVGRHDFCGGALGAARVLRNMGFDVRNVRDRT